jgi:hypothetical protein
VIFDEITMKVLLLTAAIALGAMTLTPSSQAATCHATEDPASSSPSTTSIRAVGIPCWHVTHPQSKSGTGYVSGSAHLGAYCETIADCIDNWDVVRRASSKANPIPLGLPAGRTHAFPPYLFRVTVEWMPCLINGVYAGGCGHIHAVPERWACSAAYTVIPGGEGGLPEWVQVTCRRGRASVAARLTG